MRKLTVSPNEKFNKLTVIEMIGVNEDGFSVASCRCDCGSVATVRIAELRSGHKRSCGCASWKGRSAKSSSNIVGKKFGRLTVLSLAGADEKKYRICNCVCDCGKQVKIRIARMLSGELQSCGCLQREKAMENLAKAQRVATTHGLSGTLTGVTWMAMMQRCFRVENDNYKYYGAMGVRPCAFIKASPLNLVLTIGHRPSSDMSLDRKDPNGMYSCGMCEECLTNGWTMNLRWATAKEQANNRRNSTHESQTS